MKRIIVENLSKIYQLGTQADKDQSFRELLFSQVSSLFKPSLPKKSFYALKDVSFEVQEGEVLGVIGKNGSGKSTLLKILSRITAPTSGKVTIRGRVASLLEVGTGFHGELSGRENIYLSGVILGMKRWEISKYFDEIVSFAGVEQFLDIPVKKYSSGMRLRLAFSVAAHLRPEILLIDEVLAVGDYEFEKKCIQSMSDLGKAGRTILFVSHNLVAVKKLCSRVLVLKQGREEFIGGPLQAVAAHLGTQKIASSSVVWGDVGLMLGSLLALDSLKILSTDGDEQERFFLSDPLKVHIGFRRFDSDKTALFILSFYNEEEDLLFTSSRVVRDYEAVALDAKETLVCTIPEHIFQEGVVMVGLEVFDLGYDGTLPDFEQATLFSEKNILNFVMSEHSVEKSTDRSAFLQNKKGKIKPFLKWHTS